MEAFSPLDGGEVLNGEREHEREAITIKFDDVDVADRD